MFLLEKWKLVRHKNMAILSLTSGWNGAEIPDINYEELTLNSWRISPKIKLSEDYKVYLSVMHIILLGVMSGHVIRKKRSFLWHQLTCYIPPLNHVYVMIIGCLSPRSSILKIDMHPGEHFIKEIAISLSNLS